MIDVQLHQKSLNSLELKMFLHILIFPSSHIHMDDECLHVNNRNYWRCLAWWWFVSLMRNVLNKQLFWNCSLIHIFLCKFVFNNALNLWHLPSSLRNIGVDWIICSLLFCHELCFTPLSRSFSLWTLPNESPKVIKQTVFIAQTHKMRTRSSFLLSSFLIAWE